MRNTIITILWAAIEDYVGLWETCWELNSLFPKNPNEVNEETAKRVLSCFLKNGLVTLFFSRWGSEDLKEISYTDAIILVNEERYWLPPEFNEICLKVGITEKGEQFYRKNFK